MRYFLTILMLTACFCCLSGQVIYVKTGSAGAGVSWSDALGDLQTALRRASFGTQIWVAEGIYYPNSCQNCTVAERNTPFVVPNGVKLFGGFSGSESNLSQRDFSNHPTTLSGDIDGDNELIFNAFTILFTKNVSSETVIDGFVIQDGNADLPAALGARENSGAGFFNEGQLNGNFSQPVVRNCTFKNNHALGFGGAVYNDASFQGHAATIFENCRFENNHARSGGGAVYNNATFGGTITSVFSNCIFQVNETLHGEGGAVYNSGAESGDCKPVFTDCRFEKNHAELYGGGAFNFGKTGSCTPTFLDCNFDENNAEEGGALYNNGSFHGNCSPRVERCIFTKNHVEGDGGAMYNLGSENGLSNGIFLFCEFNENHCNGAGAGIFNNGRKGDCQPEFKQCKFQQNVADNYGAAMYNLGNTGLCKPKIFNCLFLKNRATSAGAIYNIGAEQGNASPEIINCTFFGNRASVGSSIYCNASDTSGRSAPNVTNCIFYDNYAPTGAIFRCIYGAPTVSHCLFDIADCDALQSGVGSNVICGSGLIFSGLPVFADTAARDFHLRANAAAVDGGDNDAALAASISLDLDGRLRILNGRVDLGAYEFDTTTAILAPAILTQPVDNQACEGAPVRISVAASGSLPLQYQWRKNGADLPGTNSNELIFTSVKDTDAGVYNCMVTNVRGSVTSQAAHISVEKRKTVEVFVAVQNGSDFCEGQAINALATVKNGGQNPRFQWFLDSIKLRGIVGAELVFTPMQTGAHNLFCEVASSETCVVEATVASDDRQVFIHPNLTPRIEITGPDSTICVGDTVIFSAIFENGGAHPLLEWRKNGLKTAANLAEWTTAQLNDGDKIDCILTSTELCLTGSTAISNAIEVRVDSCAVGTKEVRNNWRWDLFPNPVSERISVRWSSEFQPEKLVIMNALGKLILERPVVGKNSETIDLQGFSKGIFIVKLETEGGWASRKFILSD